MSHANSREVGFDRTPRDQVEATAAQLQGPDAAGLYLKARLLL